MTRPRTGTEIADRAARAGELIEPPASQLSAGATPDRFGASAVAAGAKRPTPPTLAELLGLLHEGLERVSTFEAEFCDWMRPPPNLTLLVGPELNGSPPRGFARLRWQGGGPFPRPVQIARHIWYQRPGSIRVEVRRNHRLVRLGVRDGARWWRWDESEGVIAGDAVAHPDVDLPPLIDPPLIAPARLLGRLRLAVDGTGIRAGRHVIVARGRPRERPPGLLEARQECEFDAEHGTLLRFASFRDGQLVQSSEAVRIDYGCRIDPGRFVYADPRVEPAVPTGNAHAQRRTGSREGTGLRASTAIAPTLWLTGLPASGRTTLAHAVEAELARLSIAACVLDSDKIGDGLSSDLGGSESDRAEESRRTAHVASIVARTGAVAIVAAATPLPGARERAREIHRAAGVRFVEVWIGTPAEVCAARAASRAYPPTSSCALDDFGPRAYELSGDPDLRVSGYGSPPDAAAREVVALLLRQPIEPG